MKESYKKLTELDRIIREWNGKTNSNFWMPLYFLFVEIKLCLVEMVWTAYIKRLKISGMTWLLVEGDVDR